MMTFEAGRIRTYQISLTGVSRKGQVSYLSLSSLFSVADVLESVGQNVHSNHGDFFVSGF